MAPQHPRTGRLTERQAAILAAVERVGRPVMADLWDQFPDLAPSAIKRVLDSLEKKGLIAHAGDEHQAYLQGVHWWSTALDPGEDDVTLATVRAAIEQAALGVEHSVDPHAGVVQVFVPLVEFEGELQELPSSALDRLRSCVRELAAQGILVRLTINTKITNDPEAVVTVSVRPQVETT